jgi:multiple antibiotic resistance protein
VFLSLSSGRPESAVRQIARVTALSVAVVLLVSAWTGEIILSFFGIGIPAFRTAGGLLILLMALAMMHAKQSRAKRSPEEEDADSDKENIAVVPLAIPLLAGPGAISLVVVEGQHAQGMVGHVAVAACVILVSFLVWCALRMAQPIGERLGVTGLNVATRIMGLLLAAIGIQMIAEGVVKLFPGLQ